MEVFHIAIAFDTFLEHSRCGSLEDALDNALDDALKQITMAVVVRL